MKLRWKKEKADWHDVKYTYTAKYKGHECVVEELDTGVFTAMVTTPNSEIFPQYEDDLYNVFSERKYANKWCKGWISMLVGESG